MRSAAASSHAMVAGVADHTRWQWLGADHEKRRPGELSRGVSAQRILRHDVAGHSVGPGAASAAVGIHLALPASPAERRALTDAGEEL